MPRFSVPNMTSNVFSTASKLVFAGLLLSACAACTLQKRVPAEDLEAERQQRQILQAKQQHLLEEFRKQIAVQEELEEKLVAEDLKRRELQAKKQQLEEKLAAEDLKRREFQAKEQQLKEKLKAESAAQAELMEQIAAQSQQRQTLEEQQARFERELKQQSAARETLYDDVAALEKQLAQEHVKRQEWEQWQAQLARDLKQQSAASDRTTAELASSVEAQELKEQSVARGALEYADANLYLLLLEKKAYIARLNEQIEQVIAEVVRAKAKLLSLESKAEAASNLAEAEIAVESLRARGGVWQGDPNVIKAEQLTRLGARAFEEGNFGGALYLASQAKSLIEAARARSMDQEKSPVAEGEVPFLLPLTLQLLTESDVRKGPGSKFDVMYSWETGTALIAHAFKGQWVRVTNDKGHGGWVSYKSVGSI